MTARVGVRSEVATLNRRRRVTHRALLVHRRISNLPGSGRVTDYPSAIQLEKSRRLLESDCVVPVKPHARHMTF
jgi:hypothetical protein